MLVHDFLLLPENDGNYSNYMTYIRHPQAVKLDDNLVLYIFDTLTWIRTIHPSNPTEWGGYGLDYHGATVINWTGAAKAARVFGLWADLLREGPDELELKEGCEQREGEEFFRYRRFTLGRESVVRNLEIIGGFAEQAVSGKFYLLHIGV